MYRGSTDERANCREFKLFADGIGGMAAEETYPKTGSVRAQKRAVYAKWLSGAYVKVWTKAADLLADVKRVAQNAGFTDMGDFTTKGLSSFLNGMMAVTCRRWTRTRRWNSETRGVSGSPTWFVP